MQKAILISLEEHNNGTKYIGKLIKIMLRLTCHVELRSCQLFDQVRLYKANWQGRPYKAIAEPFTRHNPYINYKPSI